MSSTLSYSILILSLVSILSPVPTAHAHDVHKLSQSSAWARTEAERLIKAFNLSPTKSVNIVKNDPLAASPELIESSFRFPKVTGRGPTDANGTVIQDLGHHAGYFKIAHTAGARMFYFFFESRNKNKDAPVVVWLTGGPGCSSSLALFYENGPFQFMNDTSFKWNDFGWDKESNILYIDQPTGTGFSYSSFDVDERSTSVQAGVDFYYFLQAFFQKHPEYTKNGFFITGESYAGHYIPAFADEIQRRNKNNEGIKINLKGIAIGNGLTQPEIQYKAYPDFALDVKLINETQYNSLNGSVSKCVEAIRSCSASNNSTMCINAHSTCSDLFNQILNNIGSNINYYDIRKKCQSSLCYDFSGLENLFNDLTVKESLGVPSSIDFDSCNIYVNIKMSEDQMRNYALSIPRILQDGVKVLIYAGEYDLICNWLGNSRWVEDLKWPGYSTAPYTDFVVDNEKFGLQKSSGPLTFLKVFNAGHMVPMDQPKASLAMLNRWIQSKPL